MLPEKQRRSLFYFFSVISKLHWKYYDIKKVPDLIAEMNTSMVLLERDCPISLGNITTHILRHISEKINENGPLHASWMYPYERMNSWITRRVKNRSMVKECRMESVQVIKLKFSPVCSRL